MDNKERGRLISIAKKGQKYKKHKDNPTSFKKGVVPWNKGKKGIMTAWNKGKKDIYSNETKLQISNTLKKKYRDGEIVHHMKGKNHSKKTIEKIKKTKIKQFKENPELRIKISLANKGKKRSEKTKSKISESHKKEKHWNWKGGLRKLNCEICKKELFRNDSTIKKNKHLFCSQKCLGKYRSKNMIRENHPNWQGGKSFEPYDETFNNLFKRRIRKRDNQVCMLCGIHREKLNRVLSVHHINYNKLLSLKENCISLCCSCHMKTGFNRNHWIKFFQSLLSERYGYNYSKELEPIIKI